jgi:uncharacterized protein YbjT (DUF2867 family)
LVTGATGTVGREVVKQLLAAKYEVRILTRDPGRAAALGDGVEVVTGDLEQPETLAAALAGVDSVFMLAGGGPETPLHDANLAEAALRAQVRHLVKLSVNGAEGGFEDLVSTWHMAGERTIRQIAARPGGPTWTIIRPGEFMSNARLWAGSIKSKGAVYWSQVSQQVAVIDPRDVAALAVQALTSPGHEGKAYRISGPEALSTTERVVKLGTALGKQLPLIEVPIGVVSEAAGKAGRQPLVVETNLGKLTGEKYQRYAAQVLPTFEDAMGRPPRTFDDWVGDNIELFR